MFGKKNYKKIIITILALTMVFGTVALAAEGIYSKKLDATFGRIKFNYEGKDVTSQVESKYGTPGFTVDDRAYVPVRALADVLGVEIDYDHETHTAKITDGKVSSKELEEKDKEIARLKKELGELEEVKEEIKEEEKKEEDIKSNLASLKKDLNERYREYEQVEFNINLSESKGTISIQINTDLSLARDRSDWVRMRHVDKKYLIEDVVSRVRKELPKYDITGYIYDSSTRENLYTFNQKEAGSLSIANRDYIGDDYYYDREYDRYIERKVEAEFNSKGIRDARLDYLNVSRREGDFEVKFSDRYKREWQDLRDSEIKNMLDYIAKEIEYEYDDVEDIYGEIYMDGEIVAKYNKRYRDSSGTLSYRKY